MLSINSCLLAVCMSSLEKCLFSCFVHCFGVCLVFFWPTFMFIKNWHKQTKPLLIISHCTYHFETVILRHYHLGTPLPLSQPLPATASPFLDFTFGPTSTSSVSRGKLCGGLKYRMLFPRILSISSCTGSPVLHGHFHSFKMNIHADIYT